ncbi:hypothetical protein LCGC14_2140500, partial [marine sediment metagenome]
DQSTIKSPPLSIDPKVEEKKTKRIISNADKLSIPLETATNNDNMLQGIEPGGISKYRNLLLPLVPVPGGPLEVDKAKLQAFLERDRPELFTPEAKFRKAQELFDPVADPSDVDPGDYLLGVFRDIEKERYDAMRRDHEGFWDDLGWQFSQFVATAGAGVLATVSALTYDEHTAHYPTIRQDVENYAKFLREVAERPEFAMSKGGPMWKKYAALVIGNVVPYAVAAGTATAVTGTPLGAFGVAFTIEGGNSYLTTLQNGGSYGMARTNMLIEGTIVGVLEAIQIDRLIKFAPRGLGSIRSVKALAKKKTWSKIITRQITRARPVTEDFMRLAIWEGTTESLQELTSVSVESRTNPEVWEDVFGRMLGAFGLGVAGFTLLGGGKVIVTKGIGELQKLENASQYRAALPDGIDSSVKRKASQIFRRQGIEAADLYVTAAEALGEEDADTLLRAPTEVDRVKTELEKVGISRTDVEVFIKTVAKNEPVPEALFGKFADIFGMVNTGALIENIQESIDSAIFTEEELPEVISSIIEANLNLMQEETAEEGVTPPAVDLPDTKEFLQRFRSLSEKVQRAEKTPGRPMDQTEIDMLDKEGWEAYSRSRGYTDAEIADFQSHLDTIDEGLELGFTMDDLQAIDAEIRQQIRGEEVSFVRPSPED